MKTILLLLAVLAWWVSPAVAAPRHVYLTYQDDPAHSITVNFQTLGPATNPAVMYGARSPSGPLRATRVAAVSHQVPELNDGRWIHQVALRNLQPDTTYFFRAGDAANGFSEERQFRTLPAGNEPVRFITGGDMDPSQPRQQPLLAAAARCRPHLAVIGGDIGYDDGDPAKVGIWDAWLDLWDKTMRTPDGRMVPFILALGNHEVQGGWNASPTNAPVFFGFFAQQGTNTYYTRSLGSQAVLLVLDSGHIAPIDGAQKRWLTETLKQHRDTRYRFAVYHTPLYPSLRPFTDAPNAALRQQWLPVFDEYRLTAAFENHDHTFKRSRLLRGDKVVAQDGTLYLGDGCFGRDPRPVEPQLRPYLAKQGSQPHFWLVDIKPGGVEYRAVGEDGKVFDSWPEHLPPHTKP